MFVLTNNLNAIRLVNKFAYGRRQPVIDSKFPRKIFVLSRLESSIFQVTNVPPSFAEHLIHQNITRTSDA